MADFNIRADSVDVEQIMQQIRARLREKRGVDYTEQEIQELAAIKLEKFLDPRGVRSDLLERFRQSRPPAAPPAPAYAFEDTTMFESDKAIVRFFRRLLNPILKLFFNPNTIVYALHQQVELNKRNARLEGERDAQRAEWDRLYYEVMHNLVLEMTRLGIEVKNMKMKVESVSSRLDFNERRARALESVVQYKPPAAREQPAPPPAAGPPAAPGDSQGAREGESQRRRRRRRRGRRGGATGGEQQAGSPQSAGPQPAAAADRPPDTNVQPTSPDAPPSSPHDSGSSSSSDQ
jgi:cell division protein FtsL